MKQRNRQMYDIAKLNQGISNELFRFFFSSKNPTWERIPIAIVNRIRIEAKSKFATKKLATNTKATAEFKRIDSIIFIFIPYSRAQS